MLSPSVPAISHDVQEGQLWKTPASAALKTTAIQPRNSRDAAIRQGCIVGVNLFVMERPVLWYRAASQRWLRHSGRRSSFPETDMLTLRPAPYPHRRQTDFPDDPLTLKPLLHALALRYVGIVWQK